MSLGIERNTVRLKALGLFLALSASNNFRFLQTFLQIETRKIDPTFIFFSNSYKESKSILLLVNWEEKTP